MSKIGLKLDCPYVTGKQISFVAPCDSSDAECVVIDGVEYALVDASGAVMAGEPNVWKAGAIVSVILDVAAAKAYIQNEAAGAIRSINGMRPDESGDVYVDVEKLTSLVPATVSVDFTHWAGGYFTETLADGNIRVHEVLFDENGIPSEVGGIKLIGLTLSEEGE